MEAALADLLACVAAFGRSLQEKFDPQQFLVEFASRAKPLIPHDRMLIACLEDEGRTYTVFAESPGQGPPLHAGRYTTDFDPGGRYAIDEWDLESVFGGRVLLLDDVLRDARWAERPTVRERLLKVGVRARVGVPLYAGGRVIGALVVGSFTPGTYTDDHARACQQVADLIGPFVENVVLLHRERRRRRRLRAVTMLAPVLGGSLRVGDLVEHLKEALRPVLDFDRMSVRTATENARHFERLGGVEDELFPSPGIAVADENSIAGRISNGELVLIRDAPRELDANRAVDRLLIERGTKSILAVPMGFGERVDGYLYLDKDRSNWYDGADVEIARAVAAEIVVAVQHQRLADERERLSEAQARARRLEERVASLRGALADRYGFDRIIGGAPAHLGAIEQAKKVAPTETTVLITGESGTGKELFAHAIHQLSPRLDGPFIAINCAALPETLVESELFGHERGAFTGADKLKRGRFELAAGGTLFLDEIGELAPAVQAKLLRVLQERQYERVGGTATVPADVRLIVATNRDLEQAVTEGRFREDLYYRLAVFRVHLPALRDRGDDVLLIAEHFVRALGDKVGKGDFDLSRATRETLLRYPWPGNIRELQNAIERALIISDGGLITPDQLGIAVKGEACGSPLPEVAGGVPAQTVPPSGTESLADLERRAIAEALRRAKGNKSRAAVALGLSRMQLYTRLKRLGLRN
jgi:transcriptional regulator with GAF, ATPase, and Fis domain